MSFNLRAQQVIWAAAPPWHPAAEASPSGRSWGMACVLSLFSGIVMPLHHCWASGRVVDTVIASWDTTHPEQEITLFTRKIQLPSGARLLMSLDYILGWRYSIWKSANIWVSIQVLQGVGGLQSKTYNRGRQMGCYSLQIAAVPESVPTLCSVLICYVFLRCHYGVCLNEIPISESSFVWYLYGRDICLFPEPVFWFWFSVVGLFSAKKTLCSSLADKFWWLLSFCFLMWGDILILPSHPSNLFFISGTRATICLGSDFL